MILLVHCIMYLLIWPCMSSKIYSANASCPSFLTCLRCSLGLAPSIVLYGICFLLHFPVPRSFFAVFWMNPWPCHYYILYVCTLSITRLVPRLILPWETGHSMVCYQVPLEHGSQQPLNTWGAEKDGWNFGESWTSHRRTYITEYLKWAYSFIPCILTCLHGYTILMAV